MLHHLKILSILLVVAVVGCAPTGYMVNLKISKPGKTIDAVKRILIDEGFSPAETSSSNTSQRSMQVDRYQKEPSGIEKSFSSRKADYSVHVDIVHALGDTSSVKILIYNAYVGNDPKIKPTLLETADRIEKTIQDTIHEAEIIRGEGLWGVSFI